MKKNIKYHYEDVEVLNKKGIEKTITANIISEDIFFKCVHYEREIGIYLYYDTINNAGPYPILSFIEKKADRFESFEPLGQIKLNSYIFDTSLYLNDFIRISKEFYCLASVSNNRNILYIIVTNVIEETIIKVRYYEIKTFEYNNYKFYSDIRLNMFKESIAMVSSSGDSNSFYSSLIIFSYPNTQDVSKNIIDEIFDKNKILEDLIFNFNLTNYISIDNNIFGLVYSEIIIQSVQNCQKINLVSSKGNGGINDNYNLIEGDDISATFNNYDLFDCTIGYTFNATEPDYTEFENYPVQILTKNGNDEDIFNYNKKKYSGKMSYYNLYLNESLSKDCFDKCKLCYDNSEKKCIVYDCEYTIELDSNLNKYKKCIESPTETPTEPPTETPTNAPIESPTEPQTEPPIETPTELPKEPPTKIEDKLLNARDCINEDKMNQDCRNVIVKDEEYEELKSNVIKKDLNSTTQGEKKVYSMENVIIQVSRYDDQDNEDISYIDLGKCEENLRKNYSIPDSESLIIYKSDIKNKEHTSIYIDYEVYDPITLIPLNLDLCKEETVSISVSVNLNPKTESLYNSYSECGYDLFDKNDSFYSDICAICATDSGTDMSQNDKQHLIEDSGSSNFCQEGCKFQSFNKTTSKAKCDCNPADTKSIKNLNDIQFNMDLIINLFGGFKYSNYLVMKCYKLLLDFKLIQKNIGLIFMTIIIISLIVLLFIYIFIGRRKIEYYIQSILNNKSVYINNRKNMKNNNNKKVNHKQKNKKGEKNKNITTSNNKAKKLNLQNNKIQIAKKNKAQSKKNNTNKKIKN